jgi:hypothetical protein
VVVVVIVFGVAVGLTSIPSSPHWMWWI